MTIPNNPIVNAGLLYVNGLQLQYVSASTLTLINGAARNSTNVNDIILPSNIVLNGASVGPNGVDLAPLVANTHYGVYVIGDSTDNNQVAGLLSIVTATPNHVPNLPHGYDMYRRIGWIRTDSSAHILPFIQSGITEVKNYYYLTPINVLTNGTATSYALVSVGTAVPPISNLINTEVLINVSYLPSSAGNSVQFTASNSIGTGPIVQFGGGGSAIQFSTITMISSTVFDFMFYKVSAGDVVVSLDVTGYTDHIA